MSAWRREAIAALPEHRAMVERAWRPMALWIDLSMEFDDAMTAGDRDLVRRMLGYAAWCISDRAGRLPNDTSTAVVCAFYEDLPKRRTYWPSFREWFPPEMFETLRPHFAYHLSDQEMLELVAQYTGIAPKGSYRKNRPGDQIA